MFSGLKRVFVIFSTLFLLLVLSACSDSGGGGKSASSTAKPLNSASATISGQVTLSSSLSQDEAVYAVIAADDTAAVAAGNSESYSDEAGDQLGDTLDEPLVVEVDKNGKFEAQVPAGTGYTATVQLSGTLSQNAKPAMAAAALAPATSGSQLSGLSAAPGETLNLEFGELQGTGQVSLTVIDQYFASGLYGATVTLVQTGDVHSITNSSGAITLSNVVAGQQTLLIEMDGYADVTLPFVLNAGQSLNLGTVEMDSHVGGVVGQIYAEGFVSLAGVVVYLRGQDGSIYSVLSNAAGTYSFDNIPAGAGYSVIASVNRYNSEKMDNVEVFQGVTTTIPTLQLTPITVKDRGGIAGYARFAEKTDFQHAGIIVSIEGTDLEAITARDGSYVINGVPVGTYVLNFTDSNHQTQTLLDVDVVESAVTRLAPLALVSLNGGISGTLQDESGAAMSNAVVKVVETGDTTVSDGSGQFSLTDIPVGSYTLLVSKEGYEDVELNVTVSPDTVTTASGTGGGAIPLSAFSFSGSVDLGASVTDHSGATVTLSGAESFSTTTDSSGGFSFSAAPSGNYQLIISKEGYKTQTLAVYIPEDVSDYSLAYVVDMQQSYGTLSGVVQLQGTSAHSGILVSLQNTSFTTQTDLLGNWSMSLPEGTYSGGLQYSRSGYVGQTDSASYNVVGDGETTAGSITLAQQTGSISGVVEDDAATPLEGVTVTDAASGLSTTTSATGAFTFAAVVIGDYSLNISAGAYAPASVDVTVSSGATVSAGTIALTPYSFSGTVALGGGATDHSGVDVVLEGIDNLTTVSLTDGSFSLGPVTPGNYLLNLAKSGYVSQSLNITIPSVLDYTLSTPISMPQAAGSMSGVVELSGAGDHGGTVITVTDDSAGSHQTVTNSLGQWLISLPTDRSYTQVSYTAGDYQNQINDNGGAGFTLTQGQELVLSSVTLLPDVGTVSGQVTDGTNPIVDATVTIEGSNNTFIANTDGSGNYSRNDVVSGSYTITAVKEGFGTDQLTGQTVSLGGNTVANFVLVSNQVSGVIALEGAATHGGIPVVLKDNTGTVQGSTTTAADGAFTLTQVVGGTYNLVINEGGNSDYQTESLPLTIVGNDGFAYTQTIDVAKKEIVADRDLLTFDYIRGINTDINNVHHDLVLPQTMPNGSSVSWSSDDTTIIGNDGAVTIPLSTAVDTMVRLSATLTYTGQSLATQPYFDITVPPDYQPAFAKSAATLTVAEDFGFIFRNITASNANGETITYTITGNTNSTLFKSVNIDETTGELVLRSADNAHGSSSLTIEASSGTPVLTDTATLAVTVYPVADKVVADAGADQTVTPDTLVNLDGSGSSDVDGDATYTWALTSVPTGSILSVGTIATIQNTSFTPDVAGDYAIQLTLSNGAGSNVDTMLVKAYPALSVADESVSEGSAVTFTLNLSHDHDYPITLNYTTGDVTAQAYKDYQPISGSLTFAAGEVQKTLTVDVTVDQLPEAEEKFNLLLTDITGATSSTMQAAATIAYAPLDLFYLTGENGLEIINAGSSYFITKNSKIIGDFDRDGYDDIAIGAAYDNNRTGKVSVILGDTSIGTMGQYDATNAIVITGAATYDQAGFSVDGAGDFNNDGYADLLITARYGDVGIANAGTTYVIFGTTSPVNIDLSSFTTSTTTGVRIYGEASGTGTGYSAAGIQDVNGDGFDDIIIGAPYVASNQGRGYVVFGSDAYSSDIALASLGSNGVVIDGEAASDYTGLSVGKAGDVNGDGYADFLIGAPYSNTYTGTAYLIYGGASLPTSMNLNSGGTAGAVVMTGRSSYDYFAYSLDSAGDFNGDGYADLLIGAMYGPGDASSAGDATILYGGSTLTEGTVIDTSSLTSNQGIFLLGDESYSYTGRAVAGTGDVNSDGYDDVLIGAYGHTSKTGVAYVVYGGASANVALGSLDGTTGYSMTGIDVGSQLGASVGGRGDINGDGYYDLVLANGAGQKAFAVYGANHTNAVTRDLAKNDSYTGDTNAEVIVGDTGYESVETGGGADVVSLGAGYDDVFVPDLSFTRVDGGTRNDYLWLTGGGETYDLTAVLPEQIRNIEYIGFDGSDANTLVLDAETIRLLDNQTSSANPIYFYGGADDKIELLDAADWTFSKPNAYSTAVYTHISGVSFSASSELPTFPLITVEDARVNEDRGSVKVRLRRENGVYESTVAYALQDGTAVAGTDYLAQSGVVVFYAGELVKEVTVTLIRDDLFEEDKQLSMQISSPVKAVIGTYPDDTATITIVDNTIDLVELEQSRGLNMYSGATYNYIGMDIKNAGDINGDGYEDILVSGYRYNSYIVFGDLNIAGGLADVTLADLNGTDGFIISSSHYSYKFVSGVGDVNGDGFDDMVVGYQHADPSGFSNAGVTHLIFGNATIGASGELDLHDGVYTTGVDAIALNGLADNDYLGAAVAGAGDVNGDGYDDFIIGAYQSNTYTGSAYVIYGHGGAWSDVNLAALNGSNGFSMQGASTYDRFGVSVSGAGDFDGDGYGDFIIGQPTGSVNAYLVLGHASLGSTGSLALSDVAVYDLDGVSSTGYAVTGIGDFNRDGYDDIAVGSENADPDTGSGPITDAGEVYVIYGKSTASVTDLVLNSTNLNGTTGFVVQGLVDDYNQGAGLGATLARLGDMNGDGFDDLLMGAPKFNSPSGQSSDGEGKAYILYGSDYTSATYDMSTLNVASGFGIKGESSGEYFADFSLGGAGDFNGDGYSDLLLGAPYSSTNDIYGGKAYLIYGADFQGNTFYTGTSGDDSYQATSGDGSYYYPKQGNDYTFVYYGPDVIYGGHGDDGLGFSFFSPWDAADINMLNGGRGWDYLLFGYVNGGAIDLTAIPNTLIRGVETLNLHELEYSGLSLAHQLTLSVSDIMAMMDTDKHIFSINGDSVDSVVVTDGSWTYEGYLTGVSGLRPIWAGVYVNRNYHEWSLTGTPLKLRIDEDITSITGLP